MRYKILVIVLTALLIISYLTAFIDSEANDYKSISMENDFSMKDYIGQHSPDWGMLKTDKTVKGIYMTANTVNNVNRFNELVDLVDSTELNAVVIDVKNDAGLVSYKTNLNSAISAGANEKIIIKDIKQVIRSLKDKDIYPIARIVTFKDIKAGSKFSNMAIRDINGSVWRDRGGMAWLNPYNKEAWDYVIGIAEEAAVKGFKEIQFDYVRFPTDGNTNAITYGESASKMTKAEAIAAFLTYAQKKLSNKGVVVSADVFGLVTTVKGDMNIGQNLEALGKSIDVICPMVYPSHYGKGSYGVSEPDFEPYKIVNYSMKTAFERLNKLESSQKKSRLRPWLQDFTASYLKRYKKYGPDEVKAQIRATNDAGIAEWILWNAGNHYTVGALNKD